MGLPDPVARAAGIWEPEDCVFKLVHVSHPAHLAWHPAYGWTQYHRGWALTYPEACTVQDSLENDRRRWVAGNNAVLDGNVARWFVHGRRIYLAR